MPASALPECKMGFGEGWFVLFLAAPRFSHEKPAFSPPNRNRL